MKSSKTVCLLAFVSFFFPRSSSVECYGQTNAALILSVSKHEVLTNSVAGEELFVGKGPQGKWRAVIERVGPTRPIIWDSDTLRDPFFTVKAPEWITSSSEGESYEVTMRGCVPHQCTDGKIGIAIFSGKTHLLYIEHLISRDDGSYSVHFSPEGLPVHVRAKLEHAACEDPGITTPSRLPFSCY